MAPYDYEWNSKFGNGEWVTQVSTTNIDINSRFSAMNRRMEKQQAKLQSRMDKFKERTEKKFSKKIGYDNYGDAFAKMSGQVQEMFEDMKKEYSKDFKNALKEASTPKKNETKKENGMNQFLTLNVGSSKATVDLSKVRKCGLVSEKGMFGKKPKIVIYYNDRPDTPEVNFELQSEDEANSVYKNINSKLDAWAEASNSSKIAAMEKELEILYQQKDAMVEEKTVLLDVFNQFKEMMQIMEDDTKTSQLVDTIKSL